MDSIKFIETSGLEKSREVLSRSSIWCLYYSPKRDEYYSHRVYPDCISLKDLESKLSKYKTSKPNTIKDVFKLVMIIMFLFFIFLTVATYPKALLLMLYLT